MCHKKTGLVLGFFVAAGWIWHGFTSMIPCKPCRESSEPGFVFRLGCPQPSLTIIITLSTHGPSCNVRGIKSTIRCILGSRDDGSAWCRSNGIHGESRPSNTAIGYGGAGAEMWQPISDAMWLPPRASASKSPARWLGGNLSPSVACAPSLNELLPGLPVLG